MENDTFKIQSVDVIESIAQAKNNIALLRDAVPNTFSEEDTATIKSICASGTDALNDCALQIQKAIDLYTKITAPPANDSEAQA